MYRALGVCLVVFAVLAHGCGDGPASASMQALAQNSAETVVEAPEIHEYTLEVAGAIDSGELLTMHLGGTMYHCARVPSETNLSDPMPGTKPRLRCERGNTP